MTKNQGLMKTTAWLFFLIFIQQTLAQQTKNIVFPERGFVSLKAATHWEQALVSGNGKFGALVSGQPLDETIVLNHARLFIPVHEPLPPVNTGAHLKEIRRMIADGQYKRATEYVVEISKTEGYGEKRWTDPFIPAFNIRAIMKPNGEVKDYSRSVDFSTGVASVRWSDAGEINTISGDDNVKINIENGKYYIELPVKQKVNALKQPPSFNETGCYACFMQDRMTTRLSKLVLPQAKTG